MYNIYVTLDVNKSKKVKQKICLTDFKRALRNL